MIKDCLFCKIINRELPADIVFENERIIVFKDIRPVAPIHHLIVPKKHITSVNNIEIEDKELIGELFLIAKEVADKQSILKQGYRLVINVGQDAGQIIDHLHLHLLGGAKLSTKISERE